MHMFLSILPISARKPYPIATPLWAYISFIQVPYFLRLLRCKSLRMAMGFSTRPMSSKLEQLFDHSVRPVLQRGPSIQIPVSLALFGVKKDLRRSSPTVWRHIQGHPYVEIHGKGHLSNVSNPVKDVQSLPNSTVCPDTCPVGRGSTFQGKCEVGKKNKSPGATIS
jgi:hypothetical protein